MAVHRLVDAVVEDFPDEVMEARRTDAADIHARPLPDRLEPFQDSDVVRGVVRGCHVYNVRLVRSAATSARLLPCVCTLIVAIVAAFQTPIAAAAAITEDVPVPGSTAALARALGVEPAPDRARFMYEVTRIVYDTTDFRTPSVAAFLLSIRQPPRNAPPLLGGPNAAESVPVPLTTEIWADAVFRRKVTRDTLVASIVADRQASLLCNGLDRLDDETLEFFAGHPSLLGRIYERSAPIFAAFAASIHVHENRVVPVDEEASTALWELVVGEKVTRAERFLQLLFELNDGRVAFLYDTIAQADAPHRAFALGTWMPDAQRFERFKTLATTAVNGIREWHVRVLPFGRSSYDLGMALARLAVDEQGRPAPPAARGFWLRVFSSVDSSGDDSRIDAAW